jgi:Kef-type K+ transport system membrane component KefB
MNRKQIIILVVVFLMLRRLGYAAKVAFKVGFGLTQISEFGLILVTAAAVAGQVDASLVGVVGMAAMVTMLLSAYYWQYGERIYNVIKREYAYCYTGDIAALRIEQGKAIGFELWLIDRLMNLTEDEQKRFIPGVIESENLQMLQRIILE